MKKLILSMLAVMTMSLSFAQPTEERVKETAFNVLNELAENKAFQSTYPGAMFKYYTKEIFSTLTVNDIDYSSSKDVYVAYVSFNVVGFENKAVLYYQKYRGEYYLTFTEFKQSNYRERELSKKINNWIQVNPLLMLFIQQEFKGLL